MSEVVEDGEPELGALGLLPPDPQHLAVAVDGDADRQVAGARADRAVLADLDHQAVEIRDRIHRLQWPGAPCSDVLEHGVGDPRHGVAADLDAVELADVLGDVADGHPAGIEPEDPVVQARQPCLALGHELGIETAVAIARGANLDGPELGLERLALGAVADVRALRHAARRMAQMLGQLRPERRLDHPAGQPGQQPAGAGDLVRLKAPQRVFQPSAGNRPASRSTAASVGLCVLSVP